MKSFIFALLAIVLCMGTAIFGQIYVTDAVEHQLKTTDCFDPLLYENKAPEYLGRLENAIYEWRGAREMLCTFISHRDFDDIENLLLSLKGAVISGDGGNYASSLELLRERLTKLKLSEVLSLDGIL